MLKLRISRRLKGKRRPEPGTITEVNGGRIEEKMLPGEKADGTRLYIHVFRVCVLSRPGFRQPEAGVFPASSSGSAGRSYFSRPFFYKPRKGGTLSLEDVSDLLSLEDGSDLLGARQPRCCESRSKNYESFSACWGVWPLPLQIMVSKDGAHPRACLFGRYASCCKGLPYPSPRGAM